RRCGPPRRRGRRAPTGGPSLPGAGRHPFFSHPRAGGGVLQGPGLELFQVALAAPDGLWGAVEQGGGVVGAAAPKFGHLDGGITPAVILSQGEVHDLHGLFDFGRVGESGGHRIVLLGSLRSPAHRIPRPWFREVIARSVLRIASAPWAAP